MLSKPSNPFVEIDIETRQHVQETLREQFAGRPEILVDAVEQIADRVFRRYPIDALLKEDPENPEHYSIDATELIRTFGNLRAELARTIIEKAHFEAHIILLQHPAGEC